MQSSVRREVSATVRGLRRLRFGFARLRVGGVGSPIISNSLHLELQAWYRKTVTT